MPDAFKHHDGEVVPLVWNHDHSDPNNILGKALLHSRDGGLYAYCQFNNTESGQAAKELVQHGDICSLSILANQLKHNASRGVVHGMVRELSLVLAGANKGARIESVIMKHGEDFGVDDPVRELSEDEGVIYSGENLTLYHAEIQQKKEEPAMAEEAKKTEAPAKAEEAKKPEEAKNDKTVKEVWDGILAKTTEEEQTVIYAMIGQAMEDAGNDKDDKEDDNMRHSVFDNSNEERNDSVLTHADQQAIIALAKNPGVGSLKAAIEIYKEQHEDTLAHGTWENIGQLFPDFKDVHPGAPELLERDMGWVGSVMKKTKKSPVSRVRTRQADGRAVALRAKGYNDRAIEKKIGGNLKLYLRTTEPTTVYVRDTLHRDDINDVTDFDVVAYQKTVMKNNMEEVIALAALVGDLREDTDPDKIDEEKIRPVWKDDELYTIHYDIDLEAARAELQGTETGAHFGENYIRAESLVTASLYASEKYKGKGAKTMYIDPHELNVMLLARDLNGRRIYDSKADLAKAFNVDEIQTVEQFNGLTRTTADGKVKKLLCLIVNMGNYQFGSTKGGELTSFDDFDIKFNTYEYLMETRVSGALTEVFSAIAIEEDVTDDQ
jgi:hypothetical protein